ncbi:hypothetical protein IPJ70_03575 [Candidatus Campbellbacteria bacterium]|nr:MAG: hypothetical protein IPJ70_03575 [Candidatus Campbellbacteria bacterium]
MSLRKKVIHDIKICVSGAAETSSCGPRAYEVAKELGREIARQGAVIVTGATTGFPLWAAMGAKDAGGQSIGISPAASEREHVEAFRLPLDYMDMIVYTGFGYSGRDLILTRSSDAVLFGCGRIGTIHEFTIAFEDNKPIGILEGEWMTDETIKTILERSNRTHDRVVFDTNPKKLVEKVMLLVKKDKADDRMTSSYRPAEEGDILG